MATVLAGVLLMEFTRKQIRTFGTKPRVSVIGSQAMNRGLAKDFVATSAFVVDADTKFQHTETHMVITRRSSAIFRGRGWA